MKGMNFTNLIYMVLWLFCYYFVVLFIPYATDTLQAIPFLGTYWTTIPTFTQFLIQVLMYFVVPIVAIAFTIMSSGKEEVVVARG